MKQDLSPNTKQVVFGEDSIAIKKWIKGLEGGRTLYVPTDSASSSTETGYAWKNGSTILYTTKAAPTANTDKAYTDVFCTEGGKTITAYASGTGITVDGTVYAYSESDNASVAVVVDTKTEDVIKSGTPIIKLSDGKYQALRIVVTTKTCGDAKLVSEAYESLPEGAAYAGMLYRSILKDKAAASIMTWGIANPLVIAHSGAFASIKSAFVSALPHIDFETDEVA